MAFIHTGRATSHLAEGVRPIENQIPFDTSVLATSIEAVESLSDDSIATSTIAELTARLHIVEGITQTLQRIANTDIAKKFSQILISDDREWFTISKKDLVGDASDYATNWKSCRKQFIDQRKADNSSNPTTDFTRLQDKGRKMSEEALLAERMASGEAFEADTGAEADVSGGAGNKERIFAARFFDDLKGLIAAYERGMDKESENGFEHVSQSHRDLVDQYVKPCFAELAG